MTNSRIQIPAAFPLLQWQVWTSIDASLWQQWIQSNALYKSFKQSIPIVSSHLQISCYLWPPGELTDEVPRPKSVPVFMKHGVQEELTKAQRHAGI